MIATEFAPQTAAPVPNLLQLRQQTDDLWVSELKSMLANEAEGILEIAKMIWGKAQTMRRSQLTTFLKQRLGWSGVLKNSLRQAIDTAVAWGEFDLAQLQQLDPYTMISFAAKKYRPVLDELRGVKLITLQMLQDLTAKLLPKVRKPKQDPISGWDNRRGSDPIYRPILSEETGKLIEQQAELKNILPQRVIDEAVRNWVEQQSAPLEPKVDVEAESERFLREQEFQQQMEADRARIAELEQEIERLRTQPQPALSAEEAPVVEEPVAEDSDDFAHQLTQLVSKTNKREIGCLVLLQTMRSPQNGWESIREALVLYGDCKTEAWALLNDAERQQVEELMPPSVKMLEEAIVAWDVERYIEHSGGGIFTVWPMDDTEPSTVTASGVPKFLKDLRE